jgi:transposase
MREATAMTSSDQRRAWLVTKLLVGEISVAEAAALMGVSERHVWRLKAAFERDGPAALVHGNRGRASSRRLADETRSRIVELAASRYVGVNDNHLAELLAEHEAITVSRVTLRRILRAAGMASPRRRRSPRHHSRRERMPQAGLLLQVDGSRHAWLEDRGPRLEPDRRHRRRDGYRHRRHLPRAGGRGRLLTILRDTVRRHGIPAAIYRDRHTIFETPPGMPLTLEEQLVDRRAPTQLGRAPAELGITSIAARSPQAKGRIERLWGTFQDRLVSELRLAGAADRAAAEQILARYLPRHNRRFAVPAADARPAWRPRPVGLRLEQVCCLKYRRVVANDHTVRAGATILQLPPGPGRRGYAGTRVEVHLRLDGRLAVWNGERFLLVTRAPADAVQLRSLERSPVAPGSAPPSRASVRLRPADEHPWRQIDKRSKLYRRLTESVTT